MQKRHCRTEIMLLICILLSTITPLNGKKLLEHTFVFQTKYFVGHHTWTQCAIFLVLSISTLPACVVDIDCGGLNSYYDVALGKCMYIYIYIYIYNYIYIYIHTFLKR